MKELVDKVKQWGLDRGIVFTGAEGQDKRAMMEAQARYTLKETAELLDAYADRDIDKINDAIGDILVTLIVGVSSDDDLLCDMFECFFPDARLDYSLPDKSMTFLETYSNFIHYAFDVLDEKNPNDLTYTRAVLSLENILMRINYEFKQNLSLKDCLELAYNEIKSRTGKVVNGQFIKD